MLYLHSLYNVYKISIYDIKFSNHSTCHVRVEIIENYIPNLNEEYTSQPIAEYSLDLKAYLTTTRVDHESKDYEHDFLFNDGTSDGGDNTDYPPDS